MMPKSSVEMFVQMKGGLSLSAILQKTRMGDLGLSGHWCGVGH